MQHAVQPKIVVEAGADRVYAALGNQARASPNLFAAVQHLLCLRLNGGRERLQALAQKLKGFRGQSHQAVKYRMAIMIGEGLGRELRIGGIRTQRQVQIRHAAAEQLSGVEIAADQFMGVRRDLDTAQVERMMAAVGTGEIGLLARQRRFEKLAEGIQRIVPSIALLVLNEGMQGRDGDRVAVSCRGNR